MNDKTLFRAEVIESKKNQNYGFVSINTPVSYRFIAIGSMVIILLIVLFIVFAEFSEKIIISGYLDSTKGIARVYPKINGVIIQSYRHQGDKIKRGENLFLIDTSYTGVYKSQDHELFKSLKKNKEFVKKEINYKNQYLHALKKLLEKHYISWTTYNEKQEELIEIENKKTLIELEMIKYRQGKSYSIRSPIDGVVSSIIYKKGQYTNLSKPLAKIIPSDTDLVAELFIPAKKAGFLSKENKIIIRYDAYPYERFGTYKATIKEISQSIITDEEEEKPILVGEPYYKITAELDRQFVTVYGAEKRLQHGMTFSAVIVGQKRKIWQWILDPLYSYYGVLFA
ncbi:HlyD family secretion protein [Legionella feeleii]|uniref:Hemolysin D n=1 Tax=Legionella feeleii TaxID=453 RepID=A0A0W0TLP5_9GAMM|nr:HlyD family efflux transporter periplasmic adaptor subunit [Legionella feeleii]KTC96424.1 hemolysin D [Legionella feeleii]SPX61811.1 hemolysin D [Legionella feeleii]